MRTKDEILDYFSKEKNPIARKELFDLALIEVLIDIRTNLKAISESLIDIQDQMQYGGSSED